MRATVEKVIALLSYSTIDRHVLLPHDEAREKFRLPSMTVNDPFEFKVVVTKYVQHHLSCIDSSMPPDYEAFAHAKRILNGTFAKDPYQEGYFVAVQMGIDGSQGGMREVVNQIALAIKRERREAYVDHVFLEHINPMSQEDSILLTREFFANFRPLLARHGVQLPEKLYANNLRGAVDYYLQAIDGIVHSVKRW